MRTGVVIIVLAIAADCGGPPSVSAADVERCLADTLGEKGWAEIPLSETGTVYGVDFGPNSVHLFIEPDASAVEEQIGSIREAEEAVGNTGPGDQVILRDRGNVLFSWANEPTADQRALVERCVGFS